MRHYQHHFPPPPRNPSALHKVRALRCASTPAQVELCTNAIADYVETNIRAQTLDANLRIESRRDIARAGGLEAIVSRMEEHRDHPSVQIAGCRALANLSHEGGYENDRLHQHQHQHHQDQHQHHYGEFFHESSDRRRLLIARCGGVDAVLRALATSSAENNSSCEDRLAREARNDLHAHAFRALWVLSFHPRVKKAIVSKGGAQLIRRLQAEASSSSGSTSMIMDGDDQEGSGSTSSNARLWAGLALEALENKRRTSPGRRCLFLALVLLGVFALVSAAGLALCANDDPSLLPSSSSSSPKVSPLLMLACRNETEDSTRCIPSSDAGDPDD